MHKKETVGFVYFLAFTFLALTIFGWLGFYNGYNAITGAAFKVNPFDDLLSGFRNLFQNSEIMGYILVFIAVFPIIWLLVSRVHIFQGTNKWPGVLVAVSMTLISMIFVPEFTETIIGIFVYSTSLALGIIIILLVWMSYSLLHKQVSKDVGEFAEVAGQRDTARANALGARTSLISSKIPLINTKSQLSGQKEVMVRLQRELKEIDNEIRALRTLATQKASPETTNPRLLSKVNNMFDRLDNDTKIFKTYMNAGRFNDADEIYTSINAHLGQLKNLIDKF